MSVNGGLKKLNEGSLTYSGGGFDIVEEPKRSLHLQFLEEPCQSVFEGMTIDCG